MSQAAVGCHVPIGSAPAHGRLCAPAYAACGVLFVRRIGTNYMRTKRGRNFMNKFGPPIGGHAPSFNWWGLLLVSSVGYRADGKVECD